MLYTSGTTGKPKGIVRDNGGHAVALAWTMRNVYDIGPGEVFWAASDVGWVVGHSYIVYAPLLVGATTVLYEGKPVGTPDAGAFWRVIAEHGVKALFTAPTAIRAIKKEDPDRGAARGPRPLVAADAVPRGRAARPRHLPLGQRHPRHPGGRQLVADRDGVAHRGEPARASSRCRSSPGSPSVVMPGYDVQVLDERGHAGRARRRRATSPSGCRCRPARCPTLWNDDKRYVDSYLGVFTGYYTTGDGGYIDEDGYVFVMGRTDDVINVAGHRLSTGSMEAVVATHPAVAECAVIGVARPAQGSDPARLRGAQVGRRHRPGAARAARSSRRCATRSGRSPRSRASSSSRRLPKTRSGKILRRTMRGIADGRPEAPPSTIEDIGVLDVLRPLLEGR